MTTHDNSTASDDATWPLASLEQPAAEPPVLLPADGQQYFARLTRQTQWPDFEGLWDAVSSQLAQRPEAVQPTHEELALPDELLHAYLDGELSDESARQMEKALFYDPELARRLADSQALRDTLKLYAERLEMQCAISCEAFVMAEWDNAETKGIVSQPVNPAALMDKPEEAPQPKATPALLMTRLDEEQLSALVDEALEAATTDRLQQQLGQRPDMARRFADYRQLSEVLQGHYHRTVAHAPDLPADALVPLLDAATLAPVATQVIQLGSRQKAAWRWSHNQVRRHPLRYAAAIALVALVSFSVLEWLTPSGQRLTTEPQPMLSANSASDSAVEGALLQPVAQAPGSVSALRRSDIHLPPADSTQWHEWSVEPHVAQFEETPSAEVYLLELQQRDYDTNDMILMLEL